MFHERLVHNCRWIQSLGLYRSRCSYRDYLRSQQYLFQRKKWNGDLNNDLCYIWEDLPHQELYFYPFNTCLIAFTNLNKPETLRKDRYLITIYTVRKELAILLPALERADQELLCSMVLENKLLILRKANYVFQYQRDFRTEKRQENQQPTWSLLFSIYSEKFWTTFKPKSKIVILCCSMTQNENYALQSWKQHSIFARKVWKAGFTPLLVALATQVYDHAN